MKFEDVKHRIDQFFDQISPEELFRKAVLEYGFSEIIEIVDEPFGTVKTVVYSSDDEQNIFNDSDTGTENNLPLAA